MRQLLLFCIIWWTIDGAIGVGVAAGQTVKQDSLKIGDPAPPFALKELTSDQIVYLRDYCGKELRPFHKDKSVVILSFFASWCVPCKTEIPLLQQFYETFKQEPIKVFLINYTPSEQDSATHQPEPDLKRRVALAATFVKEQGYTLPVLLDEFGMTTQNYKVADQRGQARLPHLFVIDQEGMIRLINAGFGSDPLTFQQQLIAVINPLLQGAR